MGYCIALPFLASLSANDADTGDVAPEKTTIDDIRWRRECVERHYVPLLADPMPGPQEPDAAYEQPLLLDVSGRELCGTASDGG